MFMVAISEAMLPNTKAETTAPIIMMMEATAVCVLVLGPNSFPVIVRVA